MYELNRSLCSAIINGHDDTVEELLKVHEVNPNLCVPKKKSLALALACQIENVNIVRLLITNQLHPADPNKPDWDGVTPFETALKGALHSENTDVVNLLLNESLVYADVDCVFPEGSTALILAVQQQNVQLVELLLEAGADPNWNPEVMGDTICSLVLAVDQENLDICKTLLEHGSDPNTTKNNRPVVHFAAFLGNEQIVQLLLQHDADITSADGEIITSEIKVHNSHILECCLQHMYERLGDNFHAWNQDFLEKLVYLDNISWFPTLLRWGFYTCSHLPVQFDPPLFQRAVRVMFGNMLGDISARNLLLALNPYFLQESWLPMDNIPHFIIARLGNPPRLDILCRAKIIRFLGFNPLSKVKELPLPTMLMDFVQLKHVDADGI